MGLSTHQPQLDTERILKLAKKAASRYRPVDPAVSHDDLVQIGVAAIIRNLPKFAGQCSIATFAYRNARWGIVKYLDRHKKVLEKNFVDNLMPDNALSEETQRREEIEHIRVRTNRLLQTGGLSEKQRQILRLRFGLDGGEPQTFQKIGDRFDNSNQVIHYHYLNAIQKLHAKVDVTSILN